MMALVTTYRGKFPKAALVEYRRRFGISPREAAGLRHLYKPRGVRGFGMLVGVYDGVESGHDIEGGRWQTVCEIHSSIISHDTLAIARSWASVPEEWCEECMSRVATKVADE